MKPALNQMRIGFEGHCRILSAVAHCSQSLDEVAAATNIGRCTVARTMGYCLRAGVVHRPEWFRPCPHSRLVPRFKLGRGGDVSMPMYEERFRGSVGQKAAVPHGNVLTLTTLLNLMQEDRMSRLELAEAMAMHVSSIERIMRVLQAHDLVHIAEWDKPALGTSFALFAFGPGKNAKRPPQLSNGVHQRAHRQRKRMAALLGLAQPERRAA